MRNKFRIETTSFLLHIIAMGCMLLDHMWATIVPGNDWMTCVGRVAFPIFAFMLVEGYFHTSNLKKYVGRLFLFAVLSEIPFNLVMGSRVLNPVHQNVLWTFLIGILLIYLNEKVKAKHLVIRLLIAVITAFLAFAFGLVTFVDYNFAGLYMILTFYFFRGRKWWDFIAQFVLLWYINIEVLSGFYYEVRLFGHNFELVRQGFALLALIPIWLYRGKQGHHSKAFQYICYGFYPVHLLILALIRMI